MELHSQSVSKSISKPYKDKDKKKKQISIGYLGQKEGKNYQSWCQISTTHMVNVANQT